MEPPQANKFMGIAEDGFSLIENGYYGGGSGGGYSSSAAVHRRSSSTAHHYAAQYQTYQYQTEQQQPFIYYCPRMSTTTVKVPAATEGIRYYQSSRVPAAERVMTSDEAAQKFGGFVVVDHGAKRRSSKWGF